MYVCIHTRIVEWLISIDNQVNYVTIKKQTTSANYANYANWANWKLGGKSNFRHRK